jgi:hypothetical protein
MFLGLREDLLQKKKNIMIPKTNNMPAGRSSGSGLALAGRPDADPVLVGFFLCEARQFLFFPFFGKRLGRSDSNR